MCWAALKSAPHLAYSGWAKVLPSPVIDEAGCTAVVPLDELADVLGEELVEVFVLEQATATIPMTRATITNCFERLTRLLLLFWGPTRPACLTISGVEGGTRPERTALGDESVLPHIRR